MRYLFFIGLIFLFEGTFAQSSQEPFGRNRVQYNSFFWKFISTRNFELYYYGANEQLAKNAAVYAEEDYGRISELAGYTPTGKIKIVLYESENDKQQSNIGLADQEIMIGGQTVLHKATIEVAFKGTQIELMEELSFGIASVIVNAVMFGGNLKDAVKNSYVMNLPEWFMKGLAAYIAEGWSQKMDNYMRDKVLNKSLKNPTLYTGEDAVLIGQSLWNFIEREYGVQNISSLVGLTRAFRDEKESIESTFGIDFQEFIGKWKAFYTNNNSHLLTQSSALADSFLLKSTRKKAQLNGISCSPDGSKIAYVQNFKGRYKLKIMTLASRKSKTIMRGGYRRDDQAVDYQMPLSTWSNDDLLAYVYFKKGKLFLKTQSISTGKKMKKVLGEYRQVYGMNYAPSGDKLVLSADKAGQTDIFIHSLKNNTVVQVTNDPFDDLTPVFYTESQLYFSSNRQNDTLLYKGVLPEYTDLYNLYEFTVPNKILVKRIPFTGNVTNVKSDGNKVYFIGDEKGVLNLYQYEPSSKTILQKTSFTSDIESYAISKNRLHFSTYNNGKSRIFSIPVPEGKLSSVLSETARRSIYKFYVEQTLEKDTINFNFSSNEEDSFNGVIFESEMKKSNESKGVNAPLVFKPSTYLLSAPQKYPNFFSTDKVISTLMIDPIRGMGALLEGGMSDVLGNHRIDAGAFIAFDFRSTMLFGEYRFVKKRVDFKVRFDRQSMNPFNNFASHRYILNKFSGTMSYPISVYQRISLTPSFLTTTYRDVSTFRSISQQDKVVSYEALKAEYVFDNTLVTGVNMLKGTRIKLSAEYFVSNQNKEKDFGLLFFDFRKYIPIHKELIFATRFTYGHYFGNAPKNFLLGGMDNWLLSNRDFFSNANASTNNPLTIDPEVDNSDILFLRYVTSIRGFRYNSQFGSKYMLFNAELRLPVFQYFYNGTIASNFIRNLQVIGFTDIGTSYNGNLFGTNTVNTQTVSGSPFTASVTNYESPFLLGFGGGVRTTFIGYYVKADMGWGLQNSFLSKPQFYLTFGYDF